ncbi:MAG: GH3 auxin-responsive promoter family protein [Balneolaceae bacterium]|nr:GH3 auxin-responsive promoter family protein [Balneolaceae bacterium]
MFRRPEPAAAQRRQLRGLLSAASETRWGEEYAFGELQDYRDFAARVPVLTRPRLQELTDELKSGAEDLAWPGQVRRFAVSAGTTGEGRHLPVTRERLRSDRQFMRMVTLSHLRRYPNVLRLAGPHLSLPGNVEEYGGWTAGEISGYTALQAPAWLRWLQVLDPEEAVRMSFRHKMELIRRRAADLSPRVIVSAPSWLLTLFQDILEDTGAGCLREIWPRLRLLVCGGVALSSYRGHLVRLIGPPEPRFIETYGASEGYFAWSDDPERGDLLLAVDNGIFYELIPDPLPQAEAAGIQQTVPLWEAETGRAYGLVVSTNAGLWRCPVNDIVSFTSLDPPRLVVRGRVNEMLDDYGEALHLHEAEEALKEAAAELGLEETPGPFTILAYLPERGAPRHRWFLRFGRTPHRGLLEKLAGVMDRRLQKVNRHYATRRESGALEAPEMRSIRQSDIRRWLEVTGRDRAQGKLPRVIGKDDADILQSL